MPTLEFEGKAFVYSHHLSVPYRELVPVAGKGVGAPDLDGNLIIHGDNLEALKALLPRYAGKVDVIYIDPPYNTGNEGWAYNDNVTSPMMKEWLGKTVDKDDLQRHDKWLCMMWPRLQLMFELLSDDGVFFVSCDDVEFHHLRLILDEIAGSNSFVSTLVWKSRTSEDTRAKTRVSVDHEYVIAFGARPGASLAGVEKDATKFSNDDADARGAWRSADLTGLATKDRRPNLHYDLIDPETTINYGCPPKGWRYEKPTMNKKIAEKRILWPVSADGRPRHKLFEKEIKNKFKNISSVVGNVGTEAGTKELDQIFLPGTFDFPKPSAFIKALIQQAGGPDAVVLDAFAGSGTTAHAVLAANAEDFGNRSFILIQLPETLKVGSPGSAQGFESVIDVTAERVRRVIHGVPAAKDEALKAGLGGTFTYCELGEPMDSERFFAGETAPSWEQVARYVLYTATGETAAVPPEPATDFFAAEAGGRRVHVIYKADRDFLRSADAALTLERARAISAAAKAFGKSALVFGAAQYVSARQLRDLDVTFAQLPWSVHQRLAEVSA